MNLPLADQLDYYIENQDEFVREHNGRVVVIKDKQLIGVYDDTLTAVVETAKEHELGTFIAQRVSPGDEAYTATYYGNNVAFG